MSNLNWAKDGARRRMQRQGVEDSAGLSKDALRRQADALLAGYSGPVTKVPAGARVIGSQVSGNVARSVTVRSDSKKFGAAGKASKSKGRRPQGDLFGAARKSLQSSAHIGRAVPDGLVIYCDGACEPNPGAGGWGFAVYRDGVEIHSDCGGSKPTTNNVMELTGALKALQWVAIMGGERQTMDGSSHGSVRLFCDSMYVVNGCNDWRHGWKAKGWKRGGPNAKPENARIANLDLWKELDAVLTAVPIQLEWCKGHVGIIGNERADELSLMGRESVLAPARSLIDEQLDYSARGGW